MPEIENNKEKIDTNPKEQFLVEGEDPVKYLRDITFVNLQNIIAANKDRDSQIQEIISRIKLEKEKANDIESLKNAILLLKDEENDDEFHRKILELLDPLIIDAAKTSEIFFRINGILTYGVDERAKLIHIHIQPNSETNKLTFAEKKKMLLDGFSHLAEIINKDKEIQKITGMSPMIARSPKFMMSLGFSEPVPVSEDEWKENFIYEYQNNIPVSYSEIARVDFLNKYLKK
jgi:hypothetical protein